jgi:hypothetical protein
VRSIFALVGALLINAALGVVWLSLLVGAMWFVSNDMPLWGYACIAALLLYTLFLAIKGNGPENFGL